MQRTRPLNLDWRGLEHAKPHRPMTRKESKIFVKLSLSHTARTAKGGKPFPEELRKGFQEVPFTAILIDRLTRGCGIPDFMLAADPEVIMFVACLDESNTPGRAVMWAYSLGMWSAEKDCKPVTIEDLAWGPFPDGFPTEEAYLTAWDLQKKPDKGTGNQLDNSQIWRPLRDAFAQAQMDRVETKDEALELFRSMREQTIADNADLIAEMPDEATTPAQEELKAKHGTPREFAKACVNAIGEISCLEAHTAIAEYKNKWDAAS